jgi:hypothetical protein
VEDLAEVAAKKPKLEGVVGNEPFKSKGNQDQFSFNEKLEEALSSTSKQLKKMEAALAKDIPVPLTGHHVSVTQPLGKVKAAVQEGTKLVALRQKHIKLADRSEYEWKLFKEYQTVLLADDEDEGLVRPRRLLRRRQ